MEVISKMTILLVHFNHLVIDGQFSWPKLASVSWKPNYGDMLVCAALTRLIAPDLKTIRLTFGDEATGPASGAVVRGSTYLHKNFDFDKAIRTIESIDAPVACVGLGAQSPVLDPTFLDDNDQARRFVSVLSERSRSISARGAFTAAVLERLGARSIRITGCPSLFYYGLPRPVAADERLLSFYRRDRRVDSFRSRTEYFLSRSAAGARASCRRALRRGAQRQWPAHLRAGQHARISDRPP
jgi:hypothetical protein